MRAVFRASTRGRVSLDVSDDRHGAREFRAARAIAEEERSRLGVAPIEIGMMVEVASAALLADRFAAEVDFFSIGTNDLTQYTLAMDRGHPRLAPQVDGLSPAVLRLVAARSRPPMRAANGQRVCGGIAGDPQALPILVGLGLDELSVAVPAIPAIKAQIRRLRLAECRAPCATGARRRGCRRRARAGAGGVGRLNHGTRFEPAFGACCRRSASR